MAPVKSPEYKNVYVPFDAAPAVRAILERHPTALVAVEERGVGYRVTNEFPTGELSGEMIEVVTTSLLGSTPRSWAKASRNLAKAGRSCAGAVDHHRIGGKRRPWSEQPLGMK